MTETTPQPGAAPNDERTHRRPEVRDVSRSSVRRSLVRIVVGVAWLVVSSSTASAHEFGHGGDGHGSGIAPFVVVLGLPVLAGLAAGVPAIRYGSRRRSETADRASSVAVGLLLVGLGTASLVPAVAGGNLLSVAGGTTGAAITLWVTSARMPSGTGCRNHAELTLGAISAHRLLEGVVLGTLYSAGTAVGLLGVVVLAGHTALETAAVGRLYATVPPRTRAVGAIVLVQVGYVAGAAAGLGVAGAVPASVRTLALAVVGGALVAIGASETERSVAVGGPALTG